MKIKSYFCHFYPVTKWLMGECWGLWYSTGV